ncbi:MAG: ROK family protein [Bacteroidota bacterium]|jgi:glucokinase|nr:ROK family protein [Bacteroidota bacterium]
MTSIGIDVGGSSIKAVLTGGDAQVIARTQHPTLAAEPVEVTVRQMHRCIETLRADAAAAGFDPASLAGIGVGMPGAIDHARGVVYHPPNLPAWEEVPLAALLAERWGQPVRLENDANCAALGERHFGAGRAVEDFIGLTLGTGVGSGIILGGGIYHGPHGFAGEFGHMSIDAEGPLCNCGNRGCIEAYIGIHALMRDAIPALRDDPRSPLHQRAREESENIVPKDLSDAAARGDATSHRILRTAGERLGVAIASAANLLDVTTFIIGGGIAAAGAPLFDGIDASARSRVLKVHRDRLAILPAELGNDAGMLGAAALML